ncbi:MAG TPA: pectate lyase [Sphingomonas sp.]|nr:pectate lyase [Sphingomonas sp.]
MLVALVAAQAALPSDAGQRPVLAFPGAEGAGRFSLGGRGGRVIAVTTLDDSGPGSLRAAVDAQGPRTIVFRVSGTIKLARPLKIRNGRVTIAGQTAPGDGITLRDHVLEVSADDVVIRYIRSRLGAESRTQEDAIWINKGHRIILDHVSASWSVDETLSASARYDSPDQGFYDLTVQWSIIADSLRRAGHVKGDHGYGSLIRGGRGSRISFHHNLWANHIARMPRPGDYDGPDKDPIGPRFDFRNNVFYNWGGSHSGYDADTAALSQYNFIGNSYIPGPNSTGRIAFDESDRLAKAWFAGNAMEGVVPADQWSLVSGVQEPGYRLAAPVDVAPMPTESAADAERRVLRSAGASLRRDAVDARIVAGVRSRTGHVIDNERENGGWPALASLPAPRDSDGDGMPDNWERKHQLDPHKADGASDRNGDGWTNLEEYLNSLINS